jgi:hypothetical protein
MVQPQPSINIAGIRIDEPIATLTDVLVSLVCFYAFYQLQRRALPGRAQFYFKYYFLLMGIATLLGGIIGHGFLYLFSFGWKLPGWITSMLSVALIERAAIAHANPYIKPGIGKIFLIINVVELITVMTITMFTLNFQWVEFHSAYGLMIVVGSFHVYTFMKSKDQGSFIILVAIGIVCMASLTFKFKLSPHVWFNYLDLSHTLMAIAAYVFYWGALKLQRRRGGSMKLVETLT